MLKFISTRIMCKTWRLNQLMNGKKEGFVLSGKNLLNI